MRYRKLDANGDYVFGFGQQCFLIDSVEAVAQLIQTRLKLWTGEWFLDLNEGTPFATEILGRVPQKVADAAIRTRIAGTQGVVAIRKFQSSLVGRRYSASMDVQTVFGVTEVVI